MLHCNKLNDLVVPIAADTIWDDIISEPTGVVCFVDFCLKLKTFLHFAFEIFRHSVVARVITLLPVAVTRWQRCRSFPLEG